MIFVTVGLQLPFDRLIRAMDDLAGELGERVVAQTGRSAFRPSHLDARERISPVEVDAFFAEARVIVAHAGIGTILSCQRAGKPAILVPRRVSHGEHRNDHQLATVRQLENRPGIRVAYEVSDLRPLLTGPLSLPERTGAPPEARIRLTRHLEQIIQAAKVD